ncbi:MAG: hypothetical protein F4Z28_15285, partial [Gammaproteobacteria bacterium]|nr:hypothetical protein [Gammaproteobacteria bacterium]
MPDPRKNADQEYAERRALARALPIMGDGPVPRDRDLTVADDRDNLVSIIRLFLRSWPYIKPQFFGHWLSTGGRQATAKGATGEAGDGYSHAYLPFLVTALAVGGSIYY